MKKIFLWLSIFCVILCGSAGTPEAPIILEDDREEVIVNPDGTEAVDGLKTGYIHAGGSSVVLTGKRKGRRAIVVVLGSASAQLRDSHARNLMEDALSSL